MLIRNICLWSRVWPHYQMKRSKPTLLVILVKRLFKCYWRGNYETFWCNIKGLSINYNENSLNIFYKLYFVTFWWKSQFEMWFTLMFASILLNINLINKLQNEFYVYQMLLYLSIKERNYKIDITQEIFALKMLLKWY